MTGFRPERTCDQCGELIAGGIYRLPGDKFSAVCRNCHKHPTTCESDVVSVAPPLVAPPLPRRRDTCLWPECGQKIKWGLFCSRDSARFHTVMGRYPKVEITTTTDIEDAVKLWEDYQVEASKAKAEQAQAKAEQAQVAKPSVLRTCAWPGCDRQIDFGVCCHRDSSRFKSIAKRRPSIKRPAEVLQIAAIWESRNKAQQHRQPDQKVKEPKEPKEEVTVSQDQKVVDLQNELKDIRTKWCDAVVQLAAVDSALGSDKCLGHNERVGLITKRTQGQRALTVAELRRRVERLHQWEILGEVFKTGGSLQIISAETGRCFELQVEDAPELRDLLFRLEQEALS